MTKVSVVLVCYLSPLLCLCWPGWVWSLYVTCLHTCVCDDQGEYGPCMSPVSHLYTCGYANRGECVMSPVSHFHTCSCGKEREWVVLVCHLCLTSTSVAVLTGECFVICLISMPVAVLTGECFMSPVLPPCLWLCWQVNALCHLYYLHARGCADRWMLYVTCFTSILMVVLTGECFVMSPVLPPPPWLCWQVNALLRHLSHLHTSGCADRGECFVMLPVSPPCMQWPLWYWWLVLTEVNVWTLCVTSTPVAVIRWMMC